MKTDKKGFVRCPACRGKGKIPVINLHTRKQLSIDSWVVCHVCTGARKISWIEHMKNGNAKETVGIGFNDGTILPLDK